MWRAPATRLPACAAEAGSAAAGRHQQSFVCRKHGMGGAGDIRRCDDARLRPLVLKKSKGDTVDSRTGRSCGDRRDHGCIPLQASPRLSQEMSKGGVMQFGIFDQNDHGPYPLGEQYENRLKLIEFYDLARFRTYHMSEHHSTPLSLTPSPGVFLAAVAQRTKRLRLGPLVYVLPAHHPLRLVLKWVGSPLPQAQPPAADSG